MSPVAPVVSPGGAINGGTLRTGTRHPERLGKDPRADLPQDPPGRGQEGHPVAGSRGRSPLGGHSCSAHASLNPRARCRDTAELGAQSQQEPRCASRSEEPPASCDRLRPAFTLTPSSAVATPVQGAPGRQGPGGAKDCPAPSHAHLCIQPSAGWGREEGERRRKAPH